VSYGPGHKDPRDAPGPDEPLLLAISVTNYHGVYHRRARPALAFLHERTPEAVIGDSILLFDLSNDHKGTYGLAKLLAGVGKPEEARALLGRIRR